MTAPWPVLRGAGLGTTGTQDGRLDEFLIEVHPIRQDHIAKGARVLVVAVGLERDVLSEDKRAVACVAFCLEGRPSAH